MTKGEAISQVASHIAALMAAGNFEETTGVREADVCEADAQRLEWATEQVTLRLHRMGTRRGERF